MALTPAALQQQLCELDYKKQMLLNIIASYKRPGNILLALVLAYFSPFTLRQKTRKIREVWREIHYLAERMRTLQEQQVALLFIECLQEELDKLPDTIFITKTLQEEQFALLFIECFQEELNKLPDTIFIRRILQEEQFALLFIKCLREELKKLPHTIFITNPEPQKIE